MGALGVLALVIQDQNFKVLSNKVEQDIQHLKDSIQQLEKQVVSLAEMVLQNHWGLDFNCEGRTFVVLPRVKNV